MLNFEIILEGYKTPNGSFINKALPDGSMLAFEVRTQSSIKNFEKILQYSFTNQDLF